MLRRLGIRAKVLAVLAVPMLVVVLAGAFISWQSLQNLRTAQNVRNVIDAVTSSVTLSNALNDERAISLVGGTTDEVSAARAKTDAAVADFLPAMTAIDLSAFTATAAGDVGQVRRDLTDLLPQARQEQDTGQTALVRSDYGSVVDDLIVLVADLAQQINNRSVATYISAYTDVARTARDLVQEEIDGHALLVSDHANATLGQAYAVLANETEVYREAARTSVAGLGTGLALPSTDPNAGFQKDRLLIGTGDALQMSAVSATSFVDDINAQVAGLGEVSSSIFGSAGTLASQAITAAEQRAILTGGITLLAVVASFLLALAISRTIVIPLRRLTAVATDLREELPHLVEQVQVPGEGPQMSAPHIPITSRDEVGRLAGAFNAVNETTFRVAQEQAALRGSIAEMFVNVARRDQVLLNRQLSFIDSLERTEEDPQALANLFRLDHLATRMRRNAESLLVLAGIDSGRRLRDALPLSDVVRTASSEIEQYDRVELDLQADPHMLGFNALPAAHLLAELLENATVFSEPETPVVVTTAVAGPFVEVRIVDQGLGMSNDELATANAKIASTSASDTLGAQRLGLYVVGRLAQRLGAEVTLRNNSHGPTGTETVVRFPATLFQSTESSPLGVYGQAAGSVPVPPDVPPEVDLAALTDGVTERGLPRRRTADALPAPAEHTFHDDGIVLPEVSATTLPADLGAAGDDWTPLVVPDPVSTGRAAALPSRQPAAEAPPEAAGSAPAVERAADPAARVGLFAGFRVLGDRLVTPTAAAGEPVEPEAPEFAVPGLAPDEDWAPGQATTLWPVVEETEPHGATDGMPAWTEQSTDGYLPAPPTEPEPATGQWVPPEVDLAQWSVPTEPAPTFESEPDEFAGLSGWGGAPVEDSADTAAYAPFERSLDEARAWATGTIPVVPEPAGFPAAPEVSVPPVAADDELIDSSAWSQWSSDRESWSGGFVVPTLEPDDDATTVLRPLPVAEPEVAAVGPWERVVPEPVEQAAAAPSDTPVAPEWAPTPAAAPFPEVVRAADEQRGRRRGWFGRRKERAAGPALPAPPVVEPTPAAVASLPGWAPAESSATPGSLGRHGSSATPVVDGLDTRPAAAPLLTTSWAPQASWNPPAATTLPDGATGRGAPAWAPPEWTPRAARPAASESAGVASPGPDPAPGPRIGTLDDEVAAMLALRSDIQEQALSELSQLSAYRPQVVQGADRLTRRVPTVVPEAPEIVESATERDPNAVRSRLASFQSGTARGRRDAGRDGETS